MHHMVAWGTSSWVACHLRHLSVQLYANSTTAEIRESSDKTTTLTTTTTWRITTTTSGNNEQQRRVKGFVLTYDIKTICRRTLSRSYPIWSLIYCALCLWPSRTLRTRRTTTVTRATDAAPLSGENGRMGDCLDSHILRNLFNNSIRFDFAHIFS